MPDMPNQTVQISIPLFLTMYNIRPQPVPILGTAPALADPMGVETRLLVTAPLPPPPPGSHEYILQLSSATVDTDCHRSRARRFGGPLYGQ